MTTIKNDDVEVREYDRDADGSSRPKLWYASQALDGTLSPWKDVPVCSIFFDTTNKRLYMKTASTNQTTDWTQVTLGTFTGDLTISGTLTCGDLVVTNA